MSILVDAGAVVAADREEWPPLHFAAAGQHVEVARALLSAGAPIEAGAASVLRSLASTIANFDVQRWFDGSRRK